MEKEDGVGGVGVWMVRRAERSGFTQAGRAGGEGLLGVGVGGLVGGASVPFAVGGGELLVGAWWCPFGRGGEAAIAERAGGGKQERWSDAPKNLPLDFPQRSAESRSKGTYIFLHSTTTENSRKQRQSSIYKESKKRGSSQTSHGLTHTSDPPIPAPTHLTFSLRARETLPANLFTRI